MGHTKKKLFFILSFIAVVQQPKLHLFLHAYFFYRQISCCIRTFCQQHTRFTVKYNINMSYVKPVHICSPKKILLVNHLRIFFFNLRLLLTRKCLLVQKNKLNVRSNHSIVHKVTMTMPKKKNSRRRNVYGHIDGISLNLI